MTLENGNLTEAERKIAERLDPAKAGALELSAQAGGLGFANMEGAMQFAKYMAISQFAVPKHLRGNPGACLAITIQAVEWRMSPFAVANKSYLVNDRMAYESQLIQAVVLQRAPIAGPFNVAFFGEGAKRQCTITVTLRGGGERIYTSPELGKIPVQNSPLWKNDPDQQLFYYSGRVLCRRFFPDVLLGIYTPEELYEETRRGPEHARDVTPPEGQRREIIADQITDEMAERARQQLEQQNEALADPSGEKAGRLLAQRLHEAAKLASPFIADQLKEKADQIDEPRRIMGLI